jgi:hypothetical protein
MTSKIEITDDYVCQKGDVIELNYDLIGPAWLWLQSVESTAIIDHLEAKYDEFDVQSYEWTNDNTHLTITVVDKADVTVAIICAMLIGTALLLYLSKGTIYKIVQAAAAPVSLIAIAVIGFFAFKLFGRRFAK